MNDEVDRVRHDDEDAIAEIWDRFFPHLVRLANQRLAALAVAQRAFDGEDVAASALESFFRAVQKNRFQELRDADGLLRLLRTMTIRKVVDRKRRAATLKAGGGKVAGESAFANSADSALGGLGQQPSIQPSPESIAMVEEEIQRLFELLEDDELRLIARLRIEGYSNAEIARKCKCSEATVERRFKMIRARWSSLLDT